MKIKPQTLKGFRDFLPTEAIAREEVIKKIKDVFRLFGYSPLETPALEYADLLLGKYGEEADKLLYVFQDRGGRKVGLRYDQTVPTARVVAQYSELPKPFKRYQVQPVWRAENTQKGRYREFLQCDADIFGPKSYTADAEMLTLLGSCLDALNLNYEIVVNSREILFSLLKGIVQNDEKYWLNIIRSLDKLNKKSKEEVQKELFEKGLTDNQIEDIFSRLESINVEEDEWLRYVTQIATENFGLSKNRLVFKSTLARGLDYYTGIIFEAEIRNSDLGSVGGGGRYDKLIGSISGTDIPAVGFALGFDRIMEILKSDSTLADTITKVFISTIPENDDSLGLNSYSFNLTRTLRDANISTELNLEKDAKLEKQLKYADRKKIPYVVIISPNKCLQLKNMKEKTQKEVTIEELIKISKN